MLTGNSLIDPKRHALEDGATDLLAHDCRRKEFPVRLGVQVSAVEREAVFLPHDVVPVALDLVDVLGNEPRCAAVAVAVAVPRFERLLAVHVRGCRVGGGRVEVEAEECVRVQVVERRPGAVPVVGEFGVRAVARDPILFPFVDVDVGYVLVETISLCVDRSIERRMYPIVLCIFDISNSFRHLAHGFDTNDAFQSEVSLKRKPPSKVVGGNCNTVRD